MTCVFQLVTIGVSHYCEKARWALDRAGVIYTETKHVVLLHMLFTRALGAETSCPKLVMGRRSERVVLQESSDILRFADKNIRDEEDRLYPVNHEMQKLVQSWESRFDKQLGVHVRRWAYSYMLFDSCSYRLLTQGVPLLERVLAWFLLPLFQRVMTKGLSLDNPGTREQSLAVVEGFFGEVDRLLEDGRPFICGNRITAADITFAALCGPMVSPPEYGAWLPSPEECPPEMALTMQRLRKTAAGRHILKMYKTRQYKAGQRRSTLVN